MRDRKLVVKEAEAAVVRSIFERFVATGSATVLARELRREGVRSNRGSIIHKGVLYRLLSNRVYIGEAVHKGTAYPGEHAAVIDRAFWDRVHTIMQQSPRTRTSKTRAQTPALLKGLLFGPAGVAFSPTDLSPFSHLRQGRACLLM